MELLLLLLLLRAVSASRRRFQGLQECILAHLAAFLRRSLAVVKQS